MIVSGTNTPVSAKQVAAATIALAVAAAKPVAAPAPPAPSQKVQQISAVANMPYVPPALPPAQPSPTPTVQKISALANEPYVVPGQGQTPGFVPTTPAVSPPPSAAASPTPLPQPTITPVSQPKPKYTPLTGKAAVDAMYADCDLYGIDALACAANALWEGAGGTVGDGGTAFGPWHTHFLDGRVPEFVGESLYSVTVQDYAWSNAGFVFAIKGMASGGASGLTGHEAVRAIVYGYEKPQDEPGAYTTRAAEYDALKAMGAGVREYLASRFIGPQLGGEVGGVAAAPPGTGTEVSYVPAGVNAQWRGLIDVFKTTSPATRAQIQSLNKSLLGVFK